MPSSCETCRRKPTANNGLRKKCQNPAVLDFNTQSQGLALEGAQRQDNAKPPPRSGMHPRPTKNETPMLVPDLNRGTNAGMDRVDVNAHLDGTGKRHGTSQGPTKVIGRDRWNQPSSFGNSRGKNSWESNGNSKGR